MTEDSDCGFSMESLERSQGQGASFCTLPIRRKLLLSDQLSDDPEVPTSSVPERHGCDDEEDQRAKSSTPDFSSRLHTCCPAR